MSLEGDGRELQPARSSVHTALRRHGSRQRKKLRKEDFQGLIDQLRNRLGLWRTGFLYQSGHLILVQAVLSAIPIFHLMSLDHPPWVFKAIDKIRRAFLRKGTNVVKGGHCLVSLNQVCHPKESGGLGILDLKIMSSVLRLRWAWKARTSNNRVWSILINPLENHERRLLDAAARVELRDGNRCFFWTDRWINGAAVEDITPEVFSSVPSVARERRTVAEAMVSAVGIIRT